MTPQAFSTPIVSHADLPVAHIPGIEHRTLANDRQGLHDLTVWQQTMAPGAATPPHRHDAEEVVVCHSGQGELHMEGRVHRFGPNCSLLIPRNVPHQIFSVGPEPMFATAIFATSTVEVFGPDDGLMELPW
ncbi:cupin domain-containing protein [Variovorax robiniae]|uniref:Cupin domain-containing protein n=1 Tax=Variovorax robiniae TaxID=1836199 RepID=A0ABU8XA70_9BURK